MNRTRKLTWFGAAFAGLALALCSSCGGGVVPLRIQTDRPEFALLAERYQAEPGNPPVELKFVSQTGSESVDTTSPDLIISSGLYNPDTLSNLASQKSLLDDPAFHSEELYHFTFIGTKDDVRLTVLSWDLPAIISSVPETNQDFSESIMLPLDNLREKGAQFNTRTNNSLRTIGFSPFYNDDFLYLVCQYQGADLSGNARSFPSWNDESLTQAIQYLSNWSTSINDGPEKENAFLTKFAYDPVYQLLNKKRFSFAYSTASDFLRQPSLVQQNLNLHWPSWKDHIRILDNFVAAGIPQQSTRKADALKLIAWLLREDVQNQAISSILETGIHQFGFLGGFSTRRTVTEKTIPLYYPPVRLRIPPENQLDFPEIQAIRWEAFKRDTFKPWLRQRVAGTNTTSGLQEASNQWLLHMGLNP